jgi:hypothetical protein
LVSPEKTRCARFDGVTPKFIGQRQLRSTFQIGGMVASGLRRHRHRREALLALAALQVVGIKA